MSPDLDSKPTISRTRSFTLIARGIRGDQDPQAKPIMRRSRRNKPRITLRQKWIVKKRPQNVMRVPCGMSASPGEPLRN